ncbi:MAG: hypothetical protein KDE59_25050, partial [Anaerolineales bacterium]|nr:hypothetical protein [Anaerolineales bacterium]
LFMRLNSGQLFGQDYVLDIIDRFRAHDDYALFNGGNYYDLPVDVLTVEADQMLSQLDRSGSTETGARDLNQVFDSYFALQQPRGPELLVLVGAYGTNRTTQLRQIVWHALEQRQPDLLPLYIDLSDYAKVRRNTREALLQLMLRALQAVRPGLSRIELRELLREGPRFRLLFDRGEFLAEAERQRAWTEILVFAQNHPRHDLAVSAVPDSELDFLEQFAEVAVIRLYIQPLAIRKLRRFLKNGPFPADLFERIRRARLTDLATLPYFMVRILRQVEFDDLADSRAAFMQQLLDDAVLKMGGNTGMAAHVLPFLKALAWRTRVEALTEISVDDAYALAAQIRGSREYSLERFIQGLVDAWILSKAGNNRLLFSNQQIEAFCCALALRDRPDWQATVEDIVVTLGNEVRRRRWEESLVFLAALLAEEPEALKALLFKIIYGVSLFESDVVFLVARCLMQRRASATASHEHNHDLSFIHELERQLVNALQWRLDPQHESQTERAERAPALLGELAYLAPAGVVPVLAAVANQRVRVDSKGKRDFHYSHVRFTALVALEQLWESVDGSLAIKADEEQSLYNALAALEAAMLKHVAQNDTALYTLLEAWSEPVDTAALMKLFQDHVAVTEAETERSQRDVAGLAAMALGDLASKKRDEAEAAAIVRFLQGQFFALAPRKQDFTLWALTHGLAMCPEDLVHDFVVQPFVQSDKRRAEGAGDQGEKDGRMGYGLLQRHKYMTYLIGRLRLRDEESYRFLCDECLQINNMHLWIAVIDALGWITTEAPEQRKQRLGLLEDLAAGAIQKHMPEFSFSEREQLYLRQRALAVLAESGDEATLARLQNVDLGLSTTAGDPFPSVLLPQLHRTRQQILLRLEAERLARSQQEVRHE